MEPAQKQLTFPTRPKVSDGFKAKTINLISNHFTISLSAKQPSIYLYDIKVLDQDNEQIPADARDKRQGIIRAAMKQIRETFGASFWYSGLVLWSIKSFQDVKAIETKFDNKKYVLRFSKTKEVNLKPETLRDNLVASPARHYINILIKRYFKEQGFVEWGLNAKFYNADEIKKIPDFYLEVYTGFKTSCEVYQNSVPKILIDFSSRILRSDSALYYIKEAQSTQEAREMLQGCAVVSSYGNFRMWRVDDIDYTRNPTIKFELEDGSKVTLIAYYKKKYNIDIKDPTQPLLVSIDRTGREFLLVPELVQMTGLTDDMRKDFKVMTEVAKFTRLNPSQRMEKIKSLSGPLAEYFSKQFGITMDQQSPVQGFVLPPPKLTLGQGSFVPDRGNYQLRDPIFKPAKFERWIFVYADPCYQDANVFVETLIKCSGAYAISVKKPLMVGIKDKSPESLKKVIREKLKKDTQIVVAMYPVGAKKHWYKALKEVCFRENGVPCQAVVSTSLKKNAMSVCSKILLQMNAKLGLELWVTEKPLGLPEKTMIIGADVYHKTTIGQEKKSCVGFCASLNPQFNKFFSKVSFQNRVGEEIMVNIGKLVKEAVLKYFAFNGKKFFPEYIIFFRDGVAENQLQAALEFETKSILEQLKSISPDYEFKFAEIVVTKRIDDRLFSTEAERSAGGRGGREPKNFSNPPAGTIVANTIVSNNFDYLLVSQNVTQGTCTPTHFNVIYNTTDLPQDVFWNLTYSQCYNYYNWNGSVRVPAPVQYAHKLAFLVGQTVQGSPNKKLEDKLYYL